MRLKWPLIGFSIFLIIGSIFSYLNMAALTFLEDQTGRKAYIQVKETLSNIVHANDVIEACFPKIEWYSVHPATETQWFECNKRDSNNKLQMTRFDLPFRTLRVPDKAQTLPPKCRPIGKDDDTPIPVPSWCEGYVTYSGFITITKFGIWNTIVKLPNMTAEIQPKAN